jgi:2,4-dienoyl-CoA reductase-like NADH-dependent reductase (Old Yellow Enzyme family)/thioredoxin reductase
MEKEVKDNLQPDATEKHEGLSRRKFLTGTGGVSAALAVASTGLLSSRALSQTNDAPSAEHASDKRPSAAGASAPKSTKYAKNYKHLLSPIKVGNRILKNRIVATPASPHFLSGPDHYPTDGIITYYADEARNGAAVVVLSQPAGLSPIEDEDSLKARAAQPNLVNPDHGPDDPHFPTFDLVNGGCQNMLSQLTEAVHFYGSLCLMKPKIEMPHGYDVCEGNPTELRFGTDALGKFGAVILGTPPPVADRKEITEEMLQKIIADNVLKAALAKECGFDGLFLHCAYRGPLTARFLSPLTNRRTDQYGGSHENRARFCVNLFDAIKKRCGQDFFLMVSISGVEPRGGYTLDDTAKFAKIFEGHIDLLNIKGDPGEDISNPTNFVTERTPFLPWTDTLKKKGVTVSLCCDGGFTDLDLAEEAVEAEQTDVVGMARIFITNPDLGRIAYEGRSEDVVPCLRCNGCHGDGSLKPWNSTCPVNPVWGLEHRINRMILPPGSKKTVAVIGGGPAGMEAGLIAAQRGHKVTLYEKTGNLGGLFKTFEEVYFKWPHKDFKNYMVRQIAKSSVKVRLNTMATPAMIKSEGYDAVIVAVGAEPVVPDLPGIKGSNVFYAPDVFGKEDTLAKDVVIVGGGSVGTDTGMHLAKLGHQVTILEETKVVARDSVRIHFYSSYRDAWEKLPNFKPITLARCNGISEDGVTYIDAKGNQQSLKAGSVIIAVGTKPKADQALSFNDACHWFYRVGDCETAADLHNAMRSAFSAASML